VDDELLELLCTWKLEDVADDLANEGYTQVKELEEDLPEAAVTDLQVGQKYKNRLRNLLTHLHVAHQKREEKERQNSTDVQQALGQMRATPSSAQVQREGCKELETLAENDPDKRIEIAAEGGFLVVD